MMNIKKNKKKNYSMINHILNNYFSRDGSTIITDGYYPLATRESEYDERASLSWWFPLEVR